MGDLWDLRCDPKPMTTVEQVIAYFRVADPDVVVEDRKEIGTVTCPQTGDTWPESSTCCEPVAAQKVVLPGLVGGDLSC